MKKIKIAIFVVMALVLVACNNPKPEEKTPVPVEENINIIEDHKVKSEDIDKPGIVAMVLEAATDEEVVFMDHFGLFVYNLKEEKIVGSVDLKAIGMSLIQGDDATAARYDEINKKVFLYNTDQTKNYIYEIDKDRLIETDKEKINKLMENIQRSEEKGTLVKETTNPRELKYKDNQGKEYYLLKDYK